MSLAKSWFLLWAGALGFDGSSLSSRYLITARVPLAQGGRYNSLETGQLKYNASVDYWILVSFLAKGIVGIGRTLRLRRCNSLHFLGWNGELLERASGQRLPTCFPQFLVLFCDAVLVNETPTVVPHFGSVNEIDSYYRGLQSLREGDLTRYQLADEGP